MAFPAILAGITEPLISLTDNAIIGHLGTSELAGVGVGSSLYLLLVWMLAQSKSAISSIVSQYYGRNKKRAIGVFVVQSLVFNVIIGILTIGVTWLFLDELLFFYNAIGLVLENAVSYYKIRIFSLPFALATFGLFGVFRGFQNTIWAMKASLIGAILNLLLDFVFVYGIEGVIPSMGVEGAAWASLIAQIVVFGIAITTLLKKKLTVLGFPKRIDENVPVFLVMFGNLLIRTIALNTAYFLGTKYATSYGDAYVAAHTVAMNIWLFSSFFIDGYSTAGNAIAGKLLGQKDNDGIGDIGRKIGKMSVVVGSVLGLIYLLGYFFWGHFFTKDVAVIAIFESVFWIVILSQPINGLAFGLDGIFKGLGRTGLLRNTLLAATFIGFVPTLFITDLFDWKLYGVWLAFFMFMAFRGFILLFRFRLDYVKKSS